MMLEIKGLSKRFGGIRAVDNCSLEIENGKIIALIGPNGSGKSTMFNLISGIVKEDSGQIFLDGENISKYSVEKRVRSGISRIFQKSRLFDNLSIRENMLLALENEDTKFWKSFFSKERHSNDEKIKEALKLSGMDVYLNKITRNLSYGQKRLVEIARATLLPHKILMFDEPIAGVTPSLRANIANLLLSLKKTNETILIIEHDMNFVFNIADEIIVMDNGKIIARGSPEKIRKDKLVQEAYFGK